jgi:NAD(P)-dependent dehydrogenase (short-subunit alcohol dehydrogenase family)
MGRLTGKVAIITGGTSGIGRETVELFIKEGARVVFCGRGEEAGQAIAEGCGDNCIFVRADVTQEEDIKMVVDLTIEKFGELHCLFNNAGGGQGLPSVTKVSRDFIDNTFRLNFDSMCFGVKYAVPHLKKQQSSSIINNSSIAAKKAGFGDALYSAAKAAMDSYGRVAAMELARFGIRVNSVSPGATATPIFWSGSPGSKRGKTLSDEDNAFRQKKVENNIINNVSPLRIGRSGTGVDIATAALFLASDDSAWYTGQDMIVDGGITTFDAPNKAWMADENPVDPVPLRNTRKSRL